jgi:hypothetical protein
LLDLSLDALTDPENLAPCGIGNKHLKIKYFKLIFILPFRSWLIAHAKMGLTGHKQTLISDLYLIWDTWESRRGAQGSRLTQPLKTSNSERNIIATGLMT